MPLILGANSVSGYTVKNSLRFNYGSADYLSRTPASSGSTTKFTISCWLKRATVGTEENSIITQGTGTSRGILRFDALTSTTSIDLSFYIYNGTSYWSINPTAVYRDPSAWYHIIVAVDTTQATASNRVKMYVNGIQITSFANANYPTQNFALTDWNTNKLINIGRDSKDSNSWFSGYMSEFYWIDGQQLDSSSFGETDTDTGIWKPKAYTGTFGTNGFYLDFEDSANLGNDMSGNNNDFTVNNLTFIDQTTDTPTNNFCTMNPLDFGYNSTANATFSEGNLKATGNTSAWRGSHGTIGVSKGKWYFEGKAIGVPDGDTGVYIGWCDPALATTYDVGGNNADYNFYIWTNQTIKFNNSSTGSYYSFTQDDICGFALDLDNGKGYISKNGTFYNNNNTSSTPNTSNPDFTITLPPTNSGVLVPCIIGYNDGGFFLNFGNAPFTIASGNSDANGYGNFEYAVPSGYYSLCTKNLYQYGF